MSLPEAPEREALSLEGRPALPELFERIGSDLRETVKPLLARLPLIHLLTEIITLAGHAGAPVRRALLDLACLAVSKHDYTRRLYLTLVEAVAPSNPERADEVLSSLAKSGQPKKDAPLAMEMLALMAELLEVAGLEDKAIYCFTVAKLIAERFGLALNRAIVLHQLGYFLMRRGRLQDAETALGDAVRSFEQVAPSLVRQTNLLRVIIYKGRLRQTPDLPLPDDLAGFVVANAEARRIILLARARLALYQDDLDEAETLCGRARAEYGDEASLPAELLRLESAVARRRGLFEKADLLLRQAAEETGLDQFDQEITWESFYLARDLGLYDKAEKLLDQLQQVDKSLRSVYQRALIEFRRGDLAAAEKLLRQCLESSTDDVLRADCFGMLGMILEEPDEARRALHEAIGLYFKLGRKLDHAITLSHLADVEIAHGLSWKAQGLPPVAISQFPRAEKLLDQAQEIAEELGADSFLLDLKMNRAWLERLRGRYERALRLYKEAIIHVELVYLAFTRSQHATVYQSSYENLYEMALDCALEAGRTDDALLFSEHSKARRFLRDVAQTGETQISDSAPPLLKEERQILSSIQPLRNKLAQGRPLSSREQHALSQAEERLTELRQEMEQTPELSAELSQRVHQPLPAEMLRRLVFGLEPAGGRVAETSSEEPPEELPGGGVIECPQCHISNQLTSTYCSACQFLLPKTALINLNVWLGEATEEELRRAYADELYNQAARKFLEGEISEADALLEQAQQHSQHPDYSFFHGLCRLALGDPAGAISQFAEVKAQQYAGKYPFWPLPVSPGAFDRNFELLKQDQTRGDEVFDNLMQAYEDYSVRRREEKRREGKR